MPARSHVFLSHSGASCSPWTTHIQTHRRLHTTQCLTFMCRHTRLTSTVTHHSDNPTHTPAGTHEADTNPHPHILLASIPSFHCNTYFVECKPSTHQFPQAIYSLLEILWSNVLMGHSDHNINPLCLIIQVLSLMWMSLSRSQVHISNPRHEKFLKKLIFLGISSDANSLQPMVTTRLGSAWPFPLP